MRKGVIYKMPLKNKKIEPIILVEENDMELNKIYNEDCIQGLKKIATETVDIIICDPPYNIGKDFGNDSDKQDMDKYLLWCDEWIAECIRILKPQ